MKYEPLFLCSLLLSAIPLSAAETLKIHYARRDGLTAGWNMWVWNDTAKKPGFEIPQLSTDPFGALYQLDLASAGLSGLDVGLLPRRGEWEDKDAPDRILSNARPGDIYLLEEDSRIYASPPKISTGISGAWLEDGGAIRIAFNRPVDAAFIRALDLRLASGRRSFALTGAAIEDGAAGVSALLTFRGGPGKDYDAVNRGDWRLLSRNLPPAPVQLGSVMYGPQFRSDLPLGACEEKGSTVIRVFAPKAHGAEVLIYDAVGSAPASYPMTSRPGGVWEMNANRSLKGKYYRIRTRQGEKTYEGLDPYASCVTGDAGLALIGVEKAAVAPAPAFGLSEAVIYEVHLRDLTMDPFSGIESPGKYLGAAQEGTRHPLHPEIRTGLDHIAELGVNTVHILPFQDFENGDNAADYNWGYMPVNFNSPEGSYASDPAGPARVRETQAMISAFHKKGLKVVMDVVYNHTAETRSRIYNFNAMSMDYYYRVNGDGSYSNGSGCGNEFRTEAPLARRFLLDSLLHWVRDYGVDGFRFDLMGLIDQETAGELVKVLRAEKPDIIIYGEPWVAGRTPSRGVRKGTQRSKGFSVFNDRLRNALKGNVFDLGDLGYVQAAKNREAVMAGMKGSIDDFTDGPLESINYVSCHDNHTLWDRLELSLKDESFENKVKMDKLANAVVLTSQGVPFLHAGEEFLRTKNGEDNSYNLPDQVNRLDWTRKKLNLGVFEYYRELIALRKAHPAFRMKTAAEVRENMKFYEELGLDPGAPAIAYVLYGDRVGDDWGRIAVLVNPLKEPRRFPLPEGKWRTAFDGSGERKGPVKAESGTFKAAPLSLSVLYLLKPE